MIVFLGGALSGAALCGLFVTVLLESRRTAAARSSSSAGWPLGGNPTLDRMLSEAAGSGHEGIGAPARPRPRASSGAAGREVEMVDVRAMVEVYELDGVELTTPTGEEPAARLELRSCGRTGMVKVSVSVDTSEAVLTVSALDLSRALRSADVGE